MGESATKHLQRQQRKANDLTRRRTPAPPGLESPVHSGQRLQRSMGNQGVLRLMRSQRSETKQGDRQANFTRETANRGMAGAPGPLPHLDAIQRSFGHHDVSGVKAHTGAQAAAANHELNSLGYAAGDHVAFAGSPDLHTAAHEAAHVVQQQNGVQLAGGVGRAGDEYERHADAVANRVVRGETAVDLLSLSHGPTTEVVQRQATKGASILPDLSNRGIGTVDNQTDKIFIAEASEKKEAALMITKLGKGEWGGSHPAQGPKGQKLRDIDFVYATPTTPLNGVNKGKFKIGSNDATITPDPKDKKNSKIDDFNSYSP